MTQNFWKVYKAKVLQTLGGELPEEELQEERENPETMEATDSTLLTEEGSNPVSQLARRVQGVGVKGWRTVSSLFSREDEHKLLASEPCPDHPLAAKPAEDSSSEKKASGLWDVFATKWQQASAVEKMATRPNAAEEAAGGGQASEEMAAEEASNGHDNDSDLREAEGVAFKWSFLTSKLAEIKNRSNPKSN
uniref:Chromosome 1 open reading frame 230 n=1 Tax=Salvator merianae TaxID=96440 RepID=A0A8D0B674_SALMN